MCALADYKATDTCVKEEKESIPGQVLRFVDGRYGTLKAGMNCSLPFVYKGKIYEDCIGDEYGHGWCSGNATFDHHALWGSCAPVILRNAKEIAREAKGCVSIVQLQQAHRWGMGRQTNTEGVR